MGKCFQNPGAGGLNPAKAMYCRALHRALEDCEDVLDLGCGPASKLQQLDIRRVGVEGHEPSLMKAKASGTHDELIQLDVRSIGGSFSADSFDAVVALDLIEHLDRKDGLQLLSDMEMLAKKRVVIFTPNGFMSQMSQDGDLQEHLSGWTTEDFSRRAYRVNGMHGLKMLRDGVSLKYRPRVFWGVVSFLSQVLYAHRHPEVAGHLFAVLYMA